MYFSDFFRNTTNHHNHIDSFSTETGFDFPPYFLFVFRSSHPIATVALLNQPAQVLSDLKTAKYHLLGLTAHATGESMRRPIFPQMVVKSKGNPLISGKPRLVKYYSIWPDNCILYVSTLEVKLRLLNE